MESEDTKWKEKYRPLIKSKIKRMSFKRGKPHDEPKNQSRSYVCLFLLLKNYNLYGRE